MADTNAKPITPPIANTYHHRQLDGATIIAALARESAGLNSYERTLHQPAFGVLESVNIREIEYNIVKHNIAGEQLSPKGYDKIAATLSTNLNNAVATITANLAKDPKYAARTLAALKQSDEASGVSPELTALDLADQANLIDFAKTFAATFPKGIHLEGKDMPAILENFRPAVVITPPQSAPASGKNGRKQAI
jgi:hypothetical protein